MKRTLKADEKAISSTADLIRKKCREIEEMLVEKNIAYGSSATEPVRIFSRADPAEALRVRLDDKLSRLARGNPEAFGEDTLLDLVGYLVLLMIVEERTRAGD